MTWLTGRRLKTILALSLIVNLFLVGFTAGRGFDFWPPKAKRTESFIDRMADRLPAKDAEVFRAAVAARKGDIESLTSKFRQSRKTVRAAMSATPFDSKALESAFNESREMRQALERAFQEMMIATAPMLSQEGRAKLFPDRGRNR